MMKVLIVDAKHKVQRLISGWEMHVCGVKDVRCPSSVLHHFRLFTFSTSSLSASFMGSVKKQLYMDKKNKYVMGHG